MLPGVAFVILCTVVTAVSVTASFQHFLGLGLAGTALGLGQWFVGRHRGLRATWILATALGWLGGLAVVVTIEAVAGGLTAPSWAVALGFFWGLPVGLAQGGSLRIQGSVLWRRAVRLAAAHALFFMALVAMGPCAGELPIGFSTNQGPPAPTGL